MDIDVAPPRFCFSPSFSLSSLFFFLRFSKPFQSLLHESEGAGNFSLFFSMGLFTTYSCLAIVTLIKWRTSCYPTNLRLTFSPLRLIIFSKKRSSLPIPWITSMGNLLKVESKCGARVFFPQLNFSGAAIPFTMPEGERSIPLFRLLLIVDSVQRDLQNLPSSLWYFSSLQFSLSLVPQQVLRLVRSGVRTSAPFAGSAKLGSHRLQDSLEDPALSFFLGCPDPASVRNLFCANLIFFLFPQLPFAAKCSGGRGGLFTFPFDCQRGS